MTSRGGTVAATVALMLAKASSACSCPPRSSAAREKDFILTSNNGKEEVKLTQLSVPDLIRVEPKNGIRPGAEYMLRYTGGTKYWAYPSAIDFVIDKASTGPLSYGIQLKGAPQRRLLTMSDGGGSCASNQPVIAQDFRYKLPADLQPYRQAIIYRSELRTTDAYSPRPLSPIACGTPAFGNTAYGDERDLVQVDCSAPIAMRIRGQVGFLEVEDTLQTTSSLPIDLRQASGKACHGMGMLHEALAAGDTARALDLACKLPSENTYEGVFDPDAKPRRTPKIPPPSQAALAALAERATAEQRACVAGIR